MIHIRARFTEFFITFLKTSAGKFFISCKMFFFGTAKNCCELFLQTPNFKKFQRNQSATVKSVDLVCHCKSLKRNIKHRENACCQIIPRSCEVHCYIICQYVFASLYFINVKVTMAYYYIYIKNQNMVEFRQFIKNLYNCLQLIVFKNMECFSFLAKTTYLANV